MLVASPNENEGTTFAGVVLQAEGDRLEVAFPAGGCAVWRDLAVFTVPDASGEVMLRLVVSDLAADTVAA